MIKLHGKARMVCRFDNIVRKGTLKFPESILKRHFILCAAILLDKLLFKDDEGYKELLKRKHTIEELQGEENWYETIKESHQMCGKSSLYFQGEEMNGGFSTDIYKVQKMFEKSEPEYHDDEREGEYDED